MSGPGNTVVSGRGDGSDPGLAPAAATAALLPHFSVSIRDLRNGRLDHATVYVTEAWEPPTWRARWVEPIPAQSEEGGS